jgi:CubicO group peptidase (beta-lactamase class C family)
MMKKLIFWLPILCFFGSSAQTTNKPEYDHAFLLAEQWLDAQLDYDRLPGLSVGVVKDQELLWSKGFGKADVAKNIPAEPATIYSICSISKLFTSVAIMQLRDEGKVRLDDEVSKYLPWFTIKQQFADSGPITVRTLLTHSSGLPREAGFPYWTDENFPTQEQIVQKLNQQETLYPASTYFQYSNLGMTLLGQVVEKASGVPYDQYVSEKIIKPLRLVETRPSFPDELWRGKMAAGYSELNRKGERRMIDKFNTKGVAPAAGFTSNVTDLARFASWQLRLLEKGGSEILKASTLREMQQVQYMDPNWKTSWGLGFSISQVDGKTFVSHGGYCPGYQTLLMINPKDKLAFIVMINANGVNPNKYFTGIQGILAKAQEDKLYKKTPNPKLQEFCGLYSDQPWGSENCITPWGDNLAVLGVPSDTPHQYLYVIKQIEGDTFRRIREDGELGEEIIFERDKNGKVAKMWRHNNYRLKIK